MGARPNLRQLQLQLETTRWEAGSLQLQSVLPIEPVRHFDEERICRVQPQQVADITLEIAGPFLPGVPLSALVPDDEERRAGPVLPAVNQVRVERLEVESTGIGGDSGIVVRRVAIVVGRRSRRRRQL